MKPLLFSPITLRGVTLKNRVVISPMCQYSAADGMADDCHFAHLAKFALGGAGLVFTEASAVEPNGRITYGDLGIWSDAHVAPLKRIANFIKSHCSVPAMQLAHAGRKASIQRYRGRGTATVRSTGGLMGSATAARVKRGPGFQVPFAERVKKDAGLTTMAVGLILEPQHAEQILQTGQADLIAIGREALYNPNWVLHAEVALGAEGNYENWPVQYGWWLEKRSQVLVREPREKATA